MARVDSDVKSGGIIEEVAVSIGSIAIVAPVFWAIKEMLRTPEFGYRDFIFIALGLIGTLVMSKTQDFLLRRMNRQSG